MQPERSLIEIYILHCNTSGNASGRRSLSNLTLPAGINHDFYTLTQVAKGMNIWVQSVLRGLEKGEGEFHKRGGALADFL